MANRHTIITQSAKEASWIWGHERTLFLHEACEKYVDWMRELGSVYKIKAALFGQDVVSVRCTIRTMTRKLTVSIHRLWLLITQLPSISSSIRIATVSLLAEFCSLNPLDGRLCFLCYSAKAPTFR